MGEVGNGGAVIGTKVAKRVKMSGFPFVFPKRIAYICYA